MTGFRNLFSYCSFTLFCILLVHSAAAFQANESEVTKRALKSLSSLYVGGSFGSRIGSMDKTGSLPYIKKNGDSFVVECIEVLYENETQSRNSSKFWFSGVKYFAKMLW